MQTAPPLPPFIHWAHDSPHPPLATPDQLSDSGAIDSQVPDVGVPNCWMIEIGVDEEAVPDDDPPPPVDGEDAATVARSGPLVPPFKL